MSEVVLEKVIVRRTRYAKRAAVVALGIAMAASSRHNGQAWLIAGCVVAYFGAMRAFLLEEKRRDVTATHAALTLDRLRIDRARVLEGIAVQNGAFATVVLYLRGSIGRVEIDVPSVVRAEELLVALDLDTRARAVTFWTSAPRGFHFRPLELALSFVPARIVVGMEGVRLVWLTKDRIFRYSEASFEITEERVTIARAGGRAITIAIDSESRGLAERVASAIEARGDDECGAFEAALLGRGTRATREWLDAVTAIGRDAMGGYRGCAIPRERLLAIAEDAAQREDVRAAAAIAVGPKLDRGGRARIARAAGASASEDLREIFARVNEGDEESSFETALSRVA